MTRSYESEARLNRGAEKLLESLPRSILQEAHQAAARRDEATKEVSPIDIIEGLEAKRKQNRRQDRVVFASQVFGTAVALSAIILSFAVAFLTVEDRQSAISDNSGSTTSLFVTVLLVLLIVMGASLLMFVIGDVLGVFRDRMFRSSRYHNELALVNEWRVFENAMRRDLGASEPGRGPELSALMQQFASLYGVDVEDVKKILRIRNAVAHGMSRASTRDVRESLGNLRMLAHILEISENNPLRPTKPD